MKRLCAALALLIVAAAAFAVRIDTTTGATHKGEFVKKVGNLFFIKTNMATITVFKEEIKSVTSDSGADITQSFLDQPDTPLAQDTKPPALFISNISSVAVPLWITAAISLASFIYLLSSD